MVNEVCSIFLMVRMSLNQSQHTKEILFPLLQSQLTGTECNLLDFGCGPGRFTTDLAELISGKAVGVDVVPDLLCLHQNRPRWLIRVPFLLQTSSFGTTLRRWATYHNIFR
jgi:ubiquinone/menaquinone biosynthesis C-methylase UbiE